MRDPLGSFQSIKDNFIRYVETAFSTKFPGVEKERNDLLNRDKVLYRMPWIEPLPDYTSSNKKIDDLTVADLGDLLKESQLDIFKQLTQQGLFPSGINLHHHQAEMLREALQGKNCIITSGTGSGKTESFLLPLFAQLSREFTTWQHANLPSQESNTWWKDGSGLTPAVIADKDTLLLSTQTQQRRHDNRKAGLRALLLYPMNALVEDQMSRLRRALDSDDARSWFSEHGNGNRIYFGRYNGATPIAGELFTSDGKRNDYKINKLKFALSNIEDAFDKVSDYIRTELPKEADFQILSEQQKHERIKELKSFFQRLDDSSEMRCRFDMQISPPDILITNFSMMSIMLMREVDSSIFEETRKWLACEDLPISSKEDLALAKKDRIFHLIIDELHLYRGTQGSEVAYLLKLLLDRLGLHPHHEQLRILASSASIIADESENGKKSRKFLEDFFGIDWSVKPFKIIEGKVNLDNKIKITDTLPIAPFKDIAKVYTEVQGDVNNALFIDQCRQATNELASFFQIPYDPEVTIVSILGHENIQFRERLLAPFANNEAICTIRPLGDSNGGGKYFSELIFGSNHKFSDLWEGIRGILICRSLADEKSFDTKITLINNKRLPRFRFHYFVRNIEGLWSSIDRNEVDSSSYLDASRTIGKLYSASQIISEQGNRVLELLYCDNCGTTLFGGSRSIGKNGSWELLPLSPKIEGIPEKTPAKLVEKRTYQEYAIFWPQGNQNFVKHTKNRGPHAGQEADNWDDQPEINKDDSRSYVASWMPAILNIKSGDVDFGSRDDKDTPKDWIAGRVFKIACNGDDVGSENWLKLNDVVETHYALPCVCPGCGTDYSEKINRKSPIRGFRTGFSKTSQIFAKELMLQLPDNSKERKLVVFSDSREDAAQVANGIERNHFDDLLRETLLFELHHNFLLQQDLISAFENDNDAIKRYFEADHPNIFEDVSTIIYHAKSPNKAQSVSAKSKLDLLKVGCVSVRELIDLSPSNNLAPVIKKLAYLGVNPGGMNIAIRQKEIAKGIWRDWYELIDFSIGEWRPQQDLNSFVQEIRENSFTELSEMFFGHLFYSFESSGFGYLSINPNEGLLNTHSKALNIAQNLFTDIVNGTIRILGDRFKHNHSDFSNKTTFSDFRSFPAALRRWIKNVGGKNHIDTTQLGTAIYETLLGGGVLDTQKGLIIENLYIVIAKESTPIWNGSLIKRPHLHTAGGICTFSGTTRDDVASTSLLRTNETCSNLWQKNYLSFNAISGKRKPIRIHCEELTGQTDDQFERQRHFRNIILPSEGNPSVKTIDLLSVTTTLEVGVDIGSLQAVMLGNMPPQRFNYQQRVGRAGRRGQAYSVILTFCRGRSHDEFYFLNPQKITNDPPPTPFLTMNELRIMKRLLSKEVLRKAYSFNNIRFPNDEKSSIHGEFGSIGNWNSYKAFIKSWIVENKIEIERTVDILINKSLMMHRDEVIKWILDTDSHEGLLGRAQSIIDNREISADDISERLAEGGLLPMFGMPTTVKNLYHGYNKSFEPLLIDRDQSMAIFEFAPGSQKTKDKAIHTAIGFTTPFTERLSEFKNSNFRGSPFYINRWMTRCKSCGTFKTYDNQTEFRGADLMCLNCGEDKENYQRPAMLKAPYAYRTNLSQGKDRRDDVSILLTKPPIFAESNDQNLKKTATIIKNTQLSIADRDVTWRVNTNGDNLFHGKMFTVMNKFPFGRESGYNFEQQWILNDFSSRYSDNSGYIMNLTELHGAVNETIAIASHKSTEILRISPAKVSRELSLNMIAKVDDESYLKAQSYGVRAAYYSAAFLLQRLMADRLDIDPNEIEIADISRKTLESIPEKYVAEITLTDELPNGSGFVRHLYENFDSILSDLLNPTELDSYISEIHSEKHSIKCKDSCYECLKGYRNMNYHSLLDWRLGLSLLRILSDDNFLCGVDKNFKYPELRDWLSHTILLRDLFAGSFGYHRTDYIDTLPIIRWGRNSANIIIFVHPFWNISNINGDENWLAKTITKIRKDVSLNNGTLSIVDTFNLQRRPGWCYQNLINRP